MRHFQRLRPVPPEHGNIDAFTYIVPHLPTDTSTLLCIDIFLLMGWLYSLYMLCEASETVSDNSNGYIHDPTSTFEIYPPIAGTYSLAAAPTASAVRLQYIDVYMYDPLIYTTMGKG